MAQAHGGHWDPNSIGNYNQTQVPAQHQAHGGAYTPGSSVVSYPNQPYTHPYQHAVSPSTSPLSAESTNYIASPGSLGYQQSIPVGHPQTQNTMQYQQQSMGYNGQHGVVYQQGTGSGQQDGPMNKGAIDPVTTTPLATTSSSNEKEREEKEFPTKLKGSKHFFEPRSVHRWRNPVLYQKPGYNFIDGEVKMRHRDYAGRVSFKPRSDRYLHHNDGYLRNMYVACVDDIYEGPGTSTWKRTYVRKVAPLKVRIATWIIDFSYDPKSWEDWGIMLLRTFPAAIGMALCFWDGKPTVILRNLAYAPVLYQYHGDAKVWSNLLENRKGLSLMARNNQVYRMLRPRYLCFLREAFNDENRGVDVRSVVEWENSDGQDSTLSYLFVAYSTEHFSHSSERDMVDLHHIAETACRAAKLPAYWIACSCMRDENELESDVYRISDVLRGADRMAIAVGRGKASRAGSSGKANTESLLREWGSRMWTFPEVLLSPGRNISVYTRDGNLQSPMVVSKNQFAAQVWTYMDSDVARHLIDHYLGSINLSRLEQAVLALKCLYSRHTTEYLPGDQAYALMGLLRLRPQVDRTDTAFQAFSRLSLANDSDRLLERYICTLPLDKDQAWYNMEDAYESSLWDITPYCQVAGIAENDTIIIDGAWGISIRWKSFYPVYWSTGPSWKRYLAAIAIEWSGAFFIIAIALIAAGAAANSASSSSSSSSASPYSFTTTTTTGSSGTAMIIPGVIFLILFLYIWVIAPNLVRVIYGGKFADTQAEMFGFEGHLNAPTIERAIFGGNFGRFSWSTNGSPLSRSVVNEFGERVGVDPCKDPEVRMKVEAAKQARPGDMRIFTLVDTYNMTLTLFEAVRPPVTLMFCASEGGMQRAIGCSYEWETQTMYRETVLRMPTTALNRMDRVPRFRMGIQRPVYPSAPFNGAV
ncbi:hypothetical protein FAVG1_00659 [Fusarium avenaceum]|nr:hypothetical protein FAVG1_00659 [Fusarium avenaceum]